MEYIKSRKNEKIAHLKKLGADRRYRAETGLILCDGEKLLREAISHGVQIEYVLTCREEFDAQDNVRVLYAPREMIDFISPLKTAQDIVFSCRPKVWEKRLDGGVILENIQDPGNVGAMIRSANAFGIKNVMLLGDCADMYNPKTVRAAMGALFRQSTFKIDYDDVRRMRDVGIPIYGAALAPDSRPLDEADLGGCVFAIGNEGRGLSDEMLSLCDEKIIIPMNPDCESLNAAAAACVIMWEMRKNN